MVFNFYLFAMVISLSTSSFLSTWSKEWKYIYDYIIRLDCMIKSLSNMQAMINIKYNSDSVIVSTL